MAFSFSRKSALVVVLLGMACVAAYVTALCPINSNDFWWHLKTGDVIRATGSLPATDPFSYLPADDPTASGRPQLILRQYWLAQVGYSLVNEQFGLPGVVHARAGLFALMALLCGVYLWRTTRSTAGLLALFPLILTFWVVLEDSDRPHQWAFAGFLAVFLLLESCLRKGWRRPLIVLPFLQLLLAQMHPGFLAGTLLVCLYAAGTWFEERLRPFRKPLLLVAGSCLVTAFLNPNGYRLFAALLGLYADPVAMMSSEFRSPLSVWRLLLHNTGWLSYWAMVAAAFATGLLLLVRRSIVLALVLIGLAAGSLLSMRYVGFFTPVAAVIIGCEAARLFRAPLRPLVEVAFALVVAALCVVLALFPGHVNRGRIEQLLQPGLYPVRGADFLAGATFQGNIFNALSWGGYLEYRLWPEHRVFADTRFLTPLAAFGYQEVVSDTVAGRKLLQQYDVGMIIMPAVENYTGQVYPLVRRLSDDPSWALVHFDDTALIFARVPHVFSSLAKEIVWYHVLRQANTLRPLFPGVPGFQRSIDEANARLHRNLSR